MNWSQTFFLGACVLLIGCATKPKQPSIEWIGNPAVRTGDNFFPRVGWIPGYEYGFRDDGVMVWRKAKE